MTEFVIPGRAASREPGIQKSGIHFWIPGSRALLAPRNDGEGVVS
jgi:hypothetical protein